MPRRSPATFRSAAARNREHVGLARRAGAKDPLGPHVVLALIETGIAERELALGVSLVRPLLVVLARPLLQEHHLAPVRAERVAADHLAGDIDLVGDLDGRWLFARP